METKPCGCAKKVKWLRDAGGLTQKELAERAGITIRTLQHVEEGQSVSVPTLKAVARGLSGLTLKASAFVDDDLE